MTRYIQVIDLKHGMVIIDPEGNQATVVRYSRIDHERGRLETNLGVAFTAHQETFPLV